MGLLFFIIDIFSLLTAEVSTEDENIKDQELNDSAETLFNKQES